MASRVACVARAVFGSPAVPPGPGFTPEPGSVLPTVGETTFCSACLQPPAVARVPLWTCVSVFPRGPVLWAPGGPRSGATGAPVTPAGVVSTTFPPAPHKGSGLGLCSQQHLSPPDFLVRVREEAARPGGGPQGGCPRPAAVVQGGTRHPWGGLPAATARPPPGCPAPELSLCPVASTHSRMGQWAPCWPLGPLPPEPSPEATPGPAVSHQPGGGGGH